MEFRFLDKMKFRFLDKKEFRFLDEMEFIFVDKMRFIFSYKIELIIYVNVDMILFIFPNKKIDVKFASLHWLLQLWCYTKCRQWSGRQIWFWEKIRLDSYSLIVGGIHQGARALQPPGQARAKKTKKTKKTSTILQHFRNNSMIIQCQAENWWKLCFSKEVKMEIIFLKLSPVNPGVNIITRVERSSRNSDFVAATSLFAIIRFHRCVCPQCGADLYAGPAARNRPNWCLCQPFPPKKSTFKECCHIDGHRGNY